MPVLLFDIVSTVISPCFLLCLSVLFCFGVFFIAAIAATALAFARAAVRAADAFSSALLCFVNIVCGRTDDENYDSYNNYVLKHDLLPCFGLRLSFCLCFFICVDAQTYYKTDEGKYYHATADSRNYCKC